LKKTGILNPEICRVIAALGHTDMLTICDAGLPIPLHVERIDLTVVAGIPAFLDVLRAVAEEFPTEKLILAEETHQVSPPMWEEIQKVFPGVAVEFHPHVTWKEQFLARSKAVIRTGECTPYSNISLVAGVTYGEAARVATRRSQG
jgi:D-ribose pyranase